MPRRDPLPLEAVRDLLGICRAMYAAGKRRGISKPDLEELAEIGRSLTKALELARRTQPDTVGHRAAWDRAEDACARLCRAVALEMQVAPVVEAAAVRIRRIGPSASERDEKRIATRNRS